MARNATKDHNTRKTRSESQQSYYESDNDEPHVKGGEDDAAVGATETRQPVGPRGRPRARKNKAAQPNKESANADESEYLIKFRGTYERQQKALWNAALKAIRSVEVQRDEARRERDVVKHESRRRLQIQESKIRNMTEAGLRRVQELGLSVETDDDIRAHLNHLWSRVKKWVKLYGAGGVVNTLARDDQENILTALTSSGHASTSKHAFHQAIDQGSHKTTLLNAIFGKLIVDQLLDAKFFFLRGVAGQRTGANLESALLDLYDLGSQVDLDQSKLWMSQTMTMLHSRKVPVTDSPVRETSKVHASKQHFYAQFTSGLMSHKTLAPLLKQCTEIEIQNRHNEALQIVEDFGNYLLKLSTQKIRMEILNHHNLNDIPFSNSNKCMKPHPTLGLDSDDTSLDNQAILLVVEPGIQAYGTEEGRNYNISRTWSPAVVIVALKTDVSRTVMRSTANSVSMDNGSHPKTVPVKEHQKLTASGQAVVRKRAFPEEENEKHCGNAKRRHESVAPSQDESTPKINSVDLSHDERSASTEHPSTLTTNMDDMKQPEAQETKMSGFEMEVREAAATGVGKVGRPDDGELSTQNAAGVAAESLRRSPRSGQSALAAGYGSSASNPWPIG